MGAPETYKILLDTYRSQHDAFDNILQKEGILRDEFATRWWFKNKDKERFNSRWEDLRVSERKYLWERLSKYQQDLCRKTPMRADETIESWLNNPDQDFDEKEERYIAY